METDSGAPAHHHPDFHRRQRSAPEPPTSAELAEMKEWASTHAYGNSQAAQRYPRDVPRLVAEIERLRAALERVTDVGDRAAVLVAREALRETPPRPMEEQRVIRIKVGEPTDPMVVCDACWNRRGGGGAPPSDCAECGGQGMVARR